MTKKNRWTLNRTEEREKEIPAKKDEGGTGGNQKWKKKMSIAKRTAS